MLRVVKSKLYRVFFYFFYVKSLLYAKKNKCIGIFDIDNTIANTWPSFLEGFDDEKIRLLSLSPFQEMVDLVDSYYGSDRGIMFLTARDYRYYFLTKEWLKRHFKYNFSLVLVSSPMEKIKIIKKLRNNEIDFYDDMSYSHELGQVKFYSVEIDEIMKISNVRYFGYEEIIKFQGERK